RAVAQPANRRRHSCPIDGLDGKHLGSGPTNSAFEASKWRRYRACAGAAAMERGRAIVRVIQWYTGSMGAIQIEMLLRDRVHQLVGVVAHSPEKIGMDAGEVAGIGRIGLPIVGVETGLAIEADVV